VIVSLTAAEFKPLIFSVSGFILSYAANMVILTIFNDLCLLPAQFCYIIVNIWKVESCVKIADKCAPWKIFSGAENIVLQALQEKAEYFVNLKILYHTCFVGYSCPSL
jgi:hypothetical protein